MRSWTSIAESLWESVKAPLGCIGALALFIGFLAFYSWAMPYVGRWFERVTDAFYPWFVLLMLFAVWLVAGFVVMMRGIDRGDPEDRIGSLFVSALCATLGIPIAYFWNKVGVPPTSQGALLGLSQFGWLYALLIVGSLVACSRLRKPLHHKSGIIKTAAVFGFVAVNGTLLAAPIVWTMVDARVARQSLQADPIRTQLTDCADAVGEVLAAHLSDLHISEKERTRDGKTPGNSRLPSVLKAIAARSPKYLVISGDLTDQGEPKQWVLLESMLERYLPNQKIVMTPGNHDLNAFFGEDPQDFLLSEHEAELPLEPEHTTRLARAMVFQSRHLPGIQANDGLRLSDLVTNVPTRSAVEHFEREIDSCKQECFTMFATDWKVKAGCERSCGKDWRGIRFRYFQEFRQTFPWTYVDRDSNVAFLSLASTLGNSSTAGENAIGFLDNEQISRLKHELNQLPASVSLLVVTLHHPLFSAEAAQIPDVHWSELLHPGALWTRLYTSEWFVSVFLQNNPVQAKKVFDAISVELDRRPQSSAIVMFGHRHMRSLSRIGRIVLEEAPNIAADSADDVGYYLITRSVPETGVAVRWCTVR
jgi:3',5'-cyclic AMP phosphodiesterase CpdA